MKLFSIDYVVVMFFTVRRQQEAVLKKPIAAWNLRLGGKKLRPVLGANLHRH